MSVIILSEQASTPSNPTSAKVKLYVDNTSIPRLKMVDDSGNQTSLHPITNTSVTSVSGGFASDTYLDGSKLIVPAGAWRVNTVYRCVFDMVKTAAGTAAFTVTLRMGTAGTTSDTAIATFTFGAGTAAADTGMFELWALFRTVGGGTSAVVQAILECRHHLAATGLISTGASGIGILPVTSSGFNSSTPTTIGLSVNGGASFSGTNTLVTSELANL